MALLEMSLNIQETEATGRKRSHDEFTGESVKVEGSEDKMQTSSQAEGECALPSIAVTGSQSTPQATPDLTEAGSSTPTRKSPSPQTPAKGQTLLKPMVIGSASKSPANPSKRKKLTPAEKEARDKEAAKTEGRTRREGCKAKRKNVRRRLQSKGKNVRRRLQSRKKNVKRRLPSELSRKPRPKLKKAAKAKEREEKETTEGGRKRR
ncbi:hypothetical protein CEP52_000846 [Fusarium oligoseptatum]|uniref:Uncharacterized protein n=1 Tax=Fusarium oligoseptatum TaxID=2604345 RepID=A0A428ULV6_9HYPO|nr:hypothetical protein CEP52_000846 [Fusarium oligoseptatum]